MKKNKKVIRTKRPMVHATFRLKREERKTWRECAAKLGESLNEFVRVAIMERGRRVLLENYRSPTIVDQLYLLKKQRMGSVANPVPPTPMK